MESPKKCSFNEHKEINASVYCPECKIYLCNKCDNVHSGYFKNHHKYNIDKDLNQIFTGFCKEENHLELSFFCKNHNQLCCAACIAKIRAKGVGQHKDCNVCVIEDIKEEKKNKLKDNIKYLEDISNNLEMKINSLKEIYETIKEKKEKLKLEIQQIFTKIRSTLNEREDYLLLEVDKQYENSFFNENIIKESEKLPNKIQKSLKETKINEEEWNDNNQLNNYINNCINIEKNIDYIKEINENIKKVSLNKDLEILFAPEDNEINKFIDFITNFGKIKINKKGGFFQESNIIKPEDQKIILSWLEAKNLKFNILFDSKKDGDSVLTFYKKCENISPTILFFKTTKGARFGGFTTQTWESKGKKTDQNSFVFSLDKKEKYKCNNSNWAIYGDKNYFQFGGCCFRIYDQCTSNQKNYINDHKNYYDIPLNYGLTGGENKFTISSYEVYKIDT